MKCADLFSAFLTSISMVNFRCVCNTEYIISFSSILLVCQISTESNLKTLKRYSYDNERSVLKLNVPNIIVISGTPRFNSVTNSSRTVQITRYNVGLFLIFIEYFFNL